MKVTLKVKGKEATREFEKAHAVALLTLKNSQWEIDTNSTFEFIDNELRRKQNQEVNTGTTEEGISKRSKKSRK
jgi:hypothetical protein